MKFGTLLGRHISSLSAGLKAYRCVEKNFCTWSARPQSFSGEALCFSALQRAGIQCLVSQVRRGVKRLCFQVFFPFFSMRPIRLKHARIVMVRLLSSVSQRMLQQHHHFELLFPFSNASLPCPSVLLDFHVHTRVTAIFRCTYTSSNVAPRPLRCSGNCSPC